MNRKEFEDLIKQSPQHWRLIFCYGPNLFAFDRSLNEYSNLAIQIAYEVWQSNSPRAIVVTDHGLSTEQRQLLREELKGAMSGQSRNHSTW